MSKIAKTGTSTLDMDEFRSASNTKSFNSVVYTKLGTCMPPSQDYGSVLGVSRFVAAYGLKGGNVRVVLTMGAATAMLNGHPTNIVDVAVAPESRANGQSIVATLSAEGICRVWEISNQDAGGEIDARDMLNLKTKGGEPAQRVFFHPGWSTIHASKNNTLFILHESTVTGVTFTREVREEHAVDPSNGLIIDKFASVRLQRDAKVLDMAFQQLPGTSSWRCVTGHADGSVSLWSLSYGKMDTFDDDGSTISVESASVASGGTKRTSKTRQPSLLEMPPLLTIKVGASPVLTVGFASMTTIIAGTERNTEFSMWSIDPSKANSGPIQKVALTKSSGAYRNLRSSFVKRNVDGASSLVLFDSRSHDCIVLPIPAEKKNSPSLFSNVFLFNVQHAVLSVTAEYDIEKDKLVCHVVDMDCIEDLETPADVAFGSMAPQDIRNSIRRASKRAESLVVNPDTGPVEWSDKAQCCTIS